MSEKCDPLGNSVEFNFMIGIGHLGPNEHICQGSRKKSHINPLFIGVKVHELYEINDITKTLTNKLLSA